MRLFDLHCDTLYECARRHVALEQNTLAIDLCRGMRYAPWVQVFAVWVPDTLRGQQATRSCVRILQGAWRYAQQPSSLLHIVTQGEELYKEVPPNPCQAILAIEGGAAVDGDLQNLRYFAQLGVKLITITWNGSNEWGHGALSGRDEGLLPFGKAAVAEMERVGMVPDVSHLNRRGFWDVAAICRKPFIASHSLSAAVNPHPRNLEDDQFCALRDAGGLVGLSLCGEHLGEASFEQLERHLVHFLELGGERTVALGGDLDGTEIPAEWDGIRVWEQLYAYFLRRNYPSDWLERLFFKNAADFFHNALTSHPVID